MNCYFYVFFVLLVGVRIVIIENLFQNFKVFLCLSVWFNIVAFLGLLVLILLLFEVVFISC
jgi:hypothetical protein